MAQRFGRFIATPESAMEIQGRRSLANARMQQAQLEADAEAERRQWERTKDIYTLNQSRSLADRTYDLENTKLKAEQMTKAEERAFEKQKYDEAKALRDEELRAKRLANQSLESGPKSLANIRPVQQKQAVSQFLSDWEFSDADKAEEYKKRPSEINKAIVDGLAQGMTFQEVADAVGATKRNTAKPLGLLDRIRGKEPVPEREIDPFRTWEGARSTSMANTPAPEVDPRIEQAKQIVAEFKQRAAKDPTIADTADDAYVNQVMDAMDLLKGESAPSVPSAGRIVPDSQIADLNGDGKRDELDARIKAQYAEAMGLIDDMQNAQKNGMKLTADDLADLQRAKVFTKRFDKMLGDQFSKTLSAVSR